MGVNNTNTDWTTVNHGGISFYDKDVSQYGAKKDQNGNTKFFIDFKNGVKIEYEQQNKNDNPWIKTVNCGRTDVTTLINVKGNPLSTVKISDGPNDDNFIMENCSNIDINTKQYTIRPHSAPQIDYDKDTVKFINNNSNISVDYKKIK